MTGLGYTYGAAEAASLINATLAPSLAGKDVWDIPSAHQSHAAAGAQHGRIRHRGDGDFRRGCRAVGSEGAIARSAAGAAAGHAAVRRAGLWQRRLHQLRQRPPARSACRLGRRRAADGSRSRSAPIPIAIPSASRRRVTRSAMPGCSSTPTAPCRAGRRWTWPNAASRQGCAGSRSRYPAMTWPGCAGCATGCRPRSRSPPANMPGISTTYAGCWTPARWTCSRPMPRAAAASPGSWRPGRSARPITSICPGIARPRCTATSPARCPGCGTSNTSMTMCGWRQCCSTVLPQVRDGMIAPDLSRPGMGLTLKAADAARFAL